MKGLPLREKRFFIATYIIAVLLVVVSFKCGYIEAHITNYNTLIFFILITGITESVTLYFNKISFSTTFSITVASYILLGPFESMIIMLGGFLIRVLKIEDDEYLHVFNSSWYGTLFNCSMFTITYLLANYAYAQISNNGNSIYYNIIGLTIFSAVHLLTNNFILSTFISLRTEKQIWYCFMSNIKLAVLNYAIMIPFGMLLALSFEHYSYWGIIFILFPILLVRYTFTYYAEANSQYIQTVETLMNAMEARDKYTQGHSHRVSEITSILAKNMGYNQWKVERLRIAAMLHDVGKIGISDNILNKPGKLTEEEFSTIKSHPTIGESIVKDIKKLKYTIPVIRNHHERYDGKGYPDGKGGNELSLDVYIIQLADTIDAMASDRPYRKGLPKEVIIEEITKYAGTQFHPDVAAMYLKIAQTTNELDHIWET